jgi:TRAP-type C4-dicarboxylate transport system permease large subunit
METLEKWMGRIPGRLSLLTVAGGVIFATLSGSSMAGCAMLGQTLLPEMEKRGYKYQITLGPIMGCGTLAAMIPPSALGVLLASLAQISVGDFLLSIVFPGLLMAALFAIYIIIRCRLNPEVYSPFRFRHFFGDWADRIRSGYSNGIGRCRSLGMLYSRFSL